MAVDHTRGEPAWLLGSEAGRRGEKGVYRIEGWECWEPQRAGTGAVVKATSRSSGEISNSEAGQLLRHQPQYQLLLPTCLVPTSAGAGAARWVGEGAAAGRVDAPQPPHSRPWSHPHLTPTLLRVLQVTDFQPEVSSVKFFFCFYYKHIILIGKTLNTSFTVIKSKHLSDIPKKIVDKN